VTEVISFATGDALATTLTNVETACASLSSAFTNLFTTTLDKSGKTISFESKVAGATVKVTNVAVTATGDGADTDQVAIAAGGSSSPAGADEVFTSAGYYTTGNLTVATSEAATIAIKITYKTTAGGNDTDATVKASIAADADADAALDALVTAINEDDTLKTLFTAAKNSNALKITSRANNLGQQQISNVVVVAAD